MARYENTSFIDVQNNGDMVLYKVKDLQRILGCGKNKAYSIMESSGFPRVQIGREYYVEKEAFAKWIKLNTNKSFAL